MKHIKLFEEFINEIEFKDKAEYAEYIKTHKIRKGTQITFADQQEKEEESDNDKDATEVPIKEFTCYHTSKVELSTLAARPMWFTKKKKYAMAYHANAIDEGNDAFTYEIKLKGRILGLEDAARFADEAGIDHEDAVAELTANPNPSAIVKLIKPYSKICDGFDHWDYDPIDWGDAESTLIFSPNKIATIVKQIK
jgi:hypothetical protein